MKLIGITGGTGVIGKQISKLLISKGYDVIIFTRNPKKRIGNPNLRYAGWNPDAKEIDTTALQELEGFIHLAGEGVADKRWTVKRKREILESRTIGTTFITDMLMQYAPDCKVFISASAIGYYGPDKKNLPFTEDAPPYTDFLGTTCVAWEKASEMIAERMRRVIIRTGIVLAKDGGAFAEFVKPTQYGIAPWLGGGKQTISWIHIDDLAALYADAISNETYKGVYNGVAPSPVSQRLLMNTIRYKIGRWTLPLPVPAFILKILLGEMSIEVLKSATVSSQKIEDAGFHFKFSTIHNAVGALLK